MNKDTDTVVDSLDENTRRYYLDVMGVQCWQQRSDASSEVVEPEQLSQPKVQHNAGKNVAASTVPDSQENNVSQEKDYSALVTTVQQCTQCQLCDTRKQAIVGRGNQSAELMFVMLAPTSSDDDTGSICSGEANTLFSKMLSAINVSIDDVYITSLLKCAVPPKHTISPKEIQQCNNYLKQQLELIKPKRVVVLGEIAVRCLLQKDLSLDDCRGMNAESLFQIESIPIFVSYSPDELLQQAESKRKAWSDLQQLQKIIGT